ncbi:ras-related protein Rab-5A-like [Drosophila busckii]|uniref:ras-related protein Rab-5A-like n=1 Tax=Drosophila busckii TaxID=30019 RepID=UPI00083EE9D9|nr:ras-related protein Rab-5A-like [Drosophila busckii]
MQRVDTLTPKYSFNIMLLGSKAVGKTSLLYHYINDRDPQIKAPTIGAEFQVRTIKEGNSILKLKLWDSSGEPSFHNLQRSYYKDCEGIFVVFDIQSKDSFEQAVEWIDELRQTVASSTVIILVGNKTDMEACRAVTKQEAESLCKDNDLMYEETSTVTGEHVKDCFKTMTAALVQRREKAEEHKVQQMAQQEDEDEDEESPFCCCMTAPIKCDRAVVVD